MAYTIDPDVEEERLESAFLEFGGLRERLGERVHECAPSVSAWSPAQHLFHVALSADLAFSNVRALLRGGGGRIVQEGAPNALAVQVLTDESYPRGESAAPRTVTPPDEVEGAYLTNEMQLNRETLMALSADLTKVPGAEGRIPHVFLGELNASEWLRFARLHSEHHLAILRDIEAALAGN
jgi:hypothetical protein